MDFRRKLEDDPHGAFGPSPFELDMTPNPLEYSAVEGDHSSITPFTPMPSDYMRDGLKSFLPQDIAEKVSSAGAPFDWAAEAGQDASRNAKDAIQSPGVGNITQLALDASSATPAGAGAKGLGALKAIFMAPKLIGRLQDAGRIEAGSKGSLEALEKAKAAWEANADPRKVWDEHGWAPGDALGKHSRGYELEPMTWRPQDINVAKTGQTDDFLGQFSGTDELRTAFGPRGSKFPGEVQVDPKLAPSQRGGHMAYTTKNGPVELSGAKSTANTTADVNKTAYHEFQHGADAMGNINAFDDHAEYGKIVGTEAETMLESLRSELVQKNKALAAQYNELPDAHPDKMNVYAQMERNLAAMQDIPAAITGVRSEAAPYLNSLHEKRARAAASVYGSGAKNAPYPADIDTFAPEAFPSYGALGQRYKELGVEATHLRAPFQPDIDKEDLERFMATLP